MDTRADGCVDTLPTGADAEANDGETATLQDSDIKTKVGLQYLSFPKRKKNRCESLISPDKAMEIVENKPTYIEIKNSKLLTSYDGGSSHSSKTLLIHTECILFALIFVKQRMLISMT